MEALVDWIAGRGAQVIADAVASNAQPSDDDVDGSTTSTWSWASLISTRPTRAALFFLVAAYQFAALAHYVVNERERRAEQRCLAWWDARTAKKR